MLSFGVTGDGSGVVVSLGTVLLDTKGVRENRPQ